MALPDDSASPPSPAALAALFAVTAQGVDPLELLTDPTEEARKQLGTSEGETPPNEYAESTLSLTAEERKALEFELCDLLDRHDAAMQERWDQEAEIRDNYAMVPDSRHGGTDASSSHLASEATMMLVDQMAARLTNPVTHAQPPIRVDPVFGSSFLADDEVADDALRAQRFFNEYARREIDLLHLLPPTLLRTTKVGQAVWHITWEEEKRIRFYYTRDKATPTRDEKDVGRVRARLIDNRNIKVWPPTLCNWQTDSTFVGHEEFYTKGQWLALAEKFRLSEEARKLVEADPGEETPAERDDARREGIDTAQMQDQKLLSPMVRMTQLWCHMVIPGRAQAERFYLFLHRPSRQIIYINHNPHHCQKHPYFPIPYKIGENSAWATGIGQEALFAHAVDTALRNLDLDNLMSGAYWVQLWQAGTVHSTRTDHVRPGAKLIVDDVNNSFKPVKVGGDAPEIREAKEENNFRLRLATKMAPVLSGQGDPTMKSGAGTGSTLALIEQANVSIRYNERTVHTHLSEAFTFMLQLVAQYAPDGLFYRFADEADAGKLKLIKYVPPRGDLSELFNLRIEAPSAATSDESRRQSYMLLWTFALQHAQALAQWTIPVLQQENPAAIPRFLHMIAEFLNGIARRVVEHVEIPDVPGLVPEIPTLTPQDQVINQLTQAHAQAQQQIQELTAQVQQLMGMPPPGAEMGMPGAGMGAPEMPMAQPMPEMPMGAPIQ